MPCRTPRVAVLAGLLALVAAVAVGWGLPGSAAGSGAASTAHALTGHVVPAGEVANDAVVAVAAPVVDMVDAIGQSSARGAAHERGRDLFGVATLSIALLLLVAHRRRLGFARSQLVPVAVAFHGGRAPPV